MTPGLSVLYLLLLLCLCVGVVDSKQRKLHGKALDSSVPQDPASSSSLLSAPLATISNFSAPDPCLTNSSDLCYVFGKLSASQTFYNCLHHVADPQMIPTFYDNQYNGVFKLKSSITLNSLDAIDEIEGSAKLQFSLRLYWQDDRFAMPIYWAHTDNQTRENGIDLTTIITNDTIALWMPEIRFPDASSVEYQAEYLKLNASNIFMYGVGIECVLLQPKFDFKLYPNDKQTINIRFTMFNFPSDLAEQSFVINPLLFNEFYDGTATFKNNAIWSYESSNYFTSVDRGYSYAWYQIHVKRMGSGIVIRLVLPITLLVLLSGLTFWVAPENRIENAITLLLAVSALYIVILGNIPLVGYLTLVDHYVFSMFILLVFVCIFHQLHYTLSLKQDIWPLRTFYIRLIEGLGRALLIPYILLVFDFDFEVHYDIALASILIAIAVAYLSTISVKEAAGIYYAYFDAIQSLVGKMNNDNTTLKHVSWFELLAINVVLFRKFSTSSIYLVEYFGGHDTLQFRDDKDEGIKVKEMGKSQTYISNRQGQSDTSIELQSMSNSTVSALYAHAESGQQVNRVSFGNGAIAVDSDNEGSQLNRRASQRRSKRFTPGFVEEGNGSST